MKDVKMLKVMLVAVFVIGVAFSSYNAYQYQSLKNRVASFGDEITTVTDEEDAKIVIQGFLMSTELDSAGMLASADSPVQLRCPTTYPECLKHWELIKRADKYCSTFPRSDQKKCRNNYMHPYTTALNSMIDKHEYVEAFIIDCSKVCGRKENYSVAQSELSTLICPVGYNECSSEVVYIKKAMSINALDASDMLAFVRHLNKLVGLYNKLQDINKRLPDNNAQLNNPNPSQNRNVNPEDGSTEGVGANRNRSGQNNTSGTGTNQNTSTGNSQNNTTSANGNTGTGQSNTSSSGSSSSVSAPPARPWLTTSRFGGDPINGLTSDINSKEGR